MENTIVCPECSSTNIHKLGFIITRSGKIQRYQCKDCARTWT